MTLVICFDTRLHAAAVSRSWSPTPNALLRVLQKWQEKLQMTKTNIIYVEKKNKTKRGGLHKCKVHDQFIKSIRNWDFWPLTLWSTHLWLDSIFIGYSKLGIFIDNWERLLISINLIVVLNGSTIKRLGLLLSKSIFRDRIQWKGSSYL